MGVFRKLFKIGLWLFMAMIGLILLYTINLITMEPPSQDSNYKNTCDSTIYHQIYDTIPVYDTIRHKFHTKPKIIRNESTPKSDSIL